MSGQNGAEPVPETLDDGSIPELLADEHIKHFQRIAVEIETQRLKNRVALQMAGEIRTAVVGGLTPASCEVVISLATAARNVLIALERGLWTDPAENLRKLAEIQGIGDPNEDGSGPPFPPP